MHGTGVRSWFFFFQAEDGIRDLVRSRGLGDVYKRQVEGVARAHEPGGLLGGLNVQASGELHGLVGDDPDAHPVDSGEPDDDVRGEQRVDLKELALVHDVPDDLVHVVRPVSYTHLRAHETVLDLVCRLLLETKNTSIH